MNEHLDRQQREFLLKCYRTLTNDKDRDEFLHNCGGGRVFDLPPAEFPTTAPALDPCECGYEHPEQRITGPHMGDTYIICPLCHRRTAQWGIAWAARTAWNQKQTFMAEETLRQMKLF